MIASRTFLIIFFHVAFSLPCTVRVWRAQNSLLPLWPQSSVLHPQWTPLSSTNSTYHILLASGSMSSVARLQNFWVPHVILCTSALCFKDCGACVGPMNVSPEKSLNAAVSVLRKVGARNCVVFYDAMAGRPEWNLSMFLSQLSQSNVTAVSFRLEIANSARMTELKQQIRAVISDRFVLFRHFVVLCREPVLRNLFDEVATLYPRQGLLNRKFFWLILTPVSAPMKLLNHLPHFSNIILFRNIPPTKNVSDIIHIAQNCSACDVTCTNKLKTVLKSSDVLQIVATITSEGQTSLKVVANYSMGNKTFNQSDRLFPNTFVDFKGRTLLIATNSYPPLIDGNNSTFTLNNRTCFETRGSLNDLTQEISHILHFRPCFIIPSNVSGLAGDYDAKTGRATGLVGMVATGEVDMMVYGLTPTASRGKVIDFSFPYMNEPIGIVIRKDHGVANLFQALDPFDTGAWVAIAVSVVVIGLVSALIARASPVSGYNLPYPNSIRDEVLAHHKTWDSFGVIVEQGQDLYPVACSGKIVTFSWWFTALILINSYTANIVMFLTVTESSLPVSSLEDISRQDEIRPLLRDGSFLIDTFKNTANPVFQTLGEMLPVKLPGTVDEVVEMVSNSKGGKWAYMNDLTRVLYLETSDCKHLAVLPETFNNDGVLVLAWTKNAFYADRMNHFISRLVENGFMARATRKWFRNTIGIPCRNFDSSNTQFKQLTIENIFTPLFFFAIFTVIAALSLAVELAIKILRKRRFVVQ